MAILHDVLQKITRKSHQPELKIEASSATINLADKINSIGPLLALQEKKQLIEVVCSKTGERYQSMVLAVDLQQDIIALDELFPNPTYGTYQPGDQFTVRHHEDGKLLSFTATLDSLILQDGSPIYNFVLPEKVSYQQRRSSTRILLSRQQPLTVKLLSPLRTPWYATANNLSASGMRVVVGGNVIDQLHPGSLLPNCEFTFHPEIDIRCQAKVRAFRFLRRPYRHTEISMEFTDMAPQQRMQLQHLVESINSPQAA
jgi:c-di-GMP-binding flagellar brake protein YcgR